MSQSAPPPTLSSDRIQDALYGFTRSQLLFTALDLGLFTHVAHGHNTVEKLIAYLTDRENTPQEYLEHYLDPRGLRILMDGLIGIGFLRKTPTGEYTLPDDVREYLVQGSNCYMGGMVNHGKRLYENWTLLTDAVRSGQPAGGAQGLAQLEAYFAELVQGLYVSNYPTARKLADMLFLGSQRKGLHILDVAGGSAVWSITMLEADADSRATLLDFPTVVDVAKGYVHKHGLDDRYRYWPADLENVDFPAEAFDMALLSHICHALGPVATEKLIQNMGKTLKPGGELVVVDFVPDDERAQPGWPLIFAVNMLIATPEGDVFTRAQYEGWMHAAGFTHIEARELDSEVTVLIARK